ncbi:16S rRNA (guanine(527)-N(7))-methyltransferase RsmG [Bengtsoniella intestinalis]|uniref:16S rRNA (guanine(527)-N(7))-methyltransferase RsmG n=1 Tax=Bengtsoniella intestinalis TaxID=3073143 RepID=UPI00391F907C
MEKSLTVGLHELGLSTDLITPLQQYAALLVEQNKVMNLTGITEPKEVATLHFLDCLALTKLVDFSEKNVVDVGTGAGFPGIPLAIAVPTADITLLDALQKRIGFLQTVCQQVNIENTTCVHGRAEEFAKDHRASFDIATSRAVASLPMLAEFSLPLIKEGGLFLAMKAVDSDEEISAAKSALETLGGQVESVVDYTIPCTQIRHRAVLIRKVSQTPEKYPRAFAKIKKTPL